MIQKAIQTAPDLLVELSDKAEFERILEQANIVQKMTVDLSEREATEAIKTVIATYSNSDGHSYFRSQVGAVIASLNPSITQTIQKSSIQNFVQSACCSM